MAIRLSNPKQNCANANKCANADVSMRMHADVSMRMHASSRCCLNDSDRGKI
jgi:hypothetical protein